MKEEREKQFETWEQLLEALQTEYTLSFKDVCKLFKASRSWVTQHIKPYVKSIYITNNRRGNAQHGADWLYMASMVLNRRITESIWFHTEELFDFIENNCIYSITKQTKSVPVSYLMSDQNKKLYLKELKERQQEIEQEENYYKKLDLKLELRECYIKYLNTDEKTQKLYENTQDTTKRKLAEAVPVDNIKIQDIYDIWVAPHELKDYGDSDELIYRKFFREGYIRIELHIPDVNGCVGKKIFYIPDIECLPSEKNESSILVSQKDWREYNS